MGIDEDIARYAAAAKRHGEATRAGDSEAANRAYGELDSCWRSIQMSEADWQPAFLELLERPQGPFGGAGHPGLQRPNGAETLGEG
jgi:hypothetical protein